MSDNVKSAQVISIYDFSGVPPPPAALCNSSHLIIFWTAVLVAAVGIELANFKGNKH